MLCHLQDSNQRWLCWLLDKHFNEKTMESRKEELGMKEQRWDLEDICLLLNRRIGNISRE